MRRRSLAFFTDHRRCGDLDAGVDGPVVWIVCDCGASMVRRVDEDDDCCCCSHSCITPGGKGFVGEASMESWWELGDRSGLLGSEPDLAGLSCPYCGYKGNLERVFSTRRDHTELKKTMNYQVLKCGECLMLSFLMSSPSRFSGRHPMHGFKLYPPPLKGELRAPEHWPEQVGRAWVQAHNSIDTKSWDAAAAMAGRALQAATRGHLKAKPATLEKEIYELGGKGILPAPMVEWAHEIRLVRNIGAHPDPVELEVKEEDAKDIVKFLDYFLIYSLDLPKEIADYKARGSG